MHEWYGHLEISSRPQVREISRQYMLLRTYISQKTVVGLPLGGAQRLAIDPSQRVFSAFDMDQLGKNCRHLYAG